MKRSLELVATSDDGNNLEPEVSERLPCDLPPADLVAGMYRQHRDLVFHLALRLGGGHRAWAEDITQDVFVRLFHHTSHINTLDRPRGWFYRVTVNLCLNRLRRERFLRLPIVAWALGEGRAAPVQPESLGIANERLARAFVHLQSLPPKVAACMYMHHVDGLQQGEIAAILGHSKGYVSKLVARGEAALARLDREEEEP